MSREIDRIHLVVDTELEPAPVVGDPGLLDRLAGNLIENAVRYNHLHGRIWVRTGGDADHSWLVVGNTGFEVEPADVAGLFEPFRRGGRERTGGRGSGLGLSIVRAVAEAHGGTVTAGREADGGGLEVTVTLPSAEITPVVTATAAVPAPDPAPTPPRPDGAPTRHFQWRLFDGSLLIAPARSGRMSDETAARWAGSPRPDEGIGLDELALAARNHGMPLEALRYDLTPAGLHYLLVHYDIPAVDPDDGRLGIDGAVASRSAEPCRSPRRPRVTHAGHAGVRRQRPSPAAASTGQPAVAGRGGRHRRVDRHPAGAAAARGGPASDAVDVVFTGADHGIERGVVQDYQRGCRWRRRCGRRRCSRTR